MPFVDSEFTVTRVDDKRWRLTGPLVYEGRRDTFTIPAGYVTDFATVPRMMQWFAPTSGRYTLAAVLHDHLCDSLNEWGYAWLPSRYDAPPGSLDGLITSRDVDGLFRRVMRELGVGTALRWFMWCGVRWGALFNPRRRPGWWRDAPTVLALSALAVPLVAPVVVCIWVVYGVLYLFEAVTS